MAELLLEHSLLAELSLRLGKLPLRVGMLLAGLIELGLDIGDLLLSVLLSLHRRCQLLTDRVWIQTEALLRRAGAGSDAPPNVPQRRSCKVARSLHATEH